MSLGGSLLLETLYQLIISLYLEELSDFPHRNSLISPNGITGLLASV